jgi:hypothetical protein
LGLDTIRSETGQSGSKDHETDDIALLRCGCRGILGVFSQASNDVGSPVSGQDSRSIGLETAFELLDLPGALPFRWHLGFPDPHHSNGCAIGFELQFIFFAICIYRAAGDTGNLSGREVSKLLAYSRR